MRWNRNDSHPVAGMPVATFEHELGDAGFVEVAETFIAVHSALFALREGILYVRVLQPALHYELEQISKAEILRKLKQRFGVKIIPDIRFRIGWPSADAPARSSASGSNRRNSAFSREVGPADFGQTSYVNRPVARWLKTTFNAWTISTEMINDYTSNL